MRYRAIVADPPWRYRTDISKMSREHREKGWSGARPQYDTLTFEQIAGMNVLDYAADDAHLYLWITNGMLVDPAHPAHMICAAWGFRPVTLITWAKHKVNRPGEPSRKTGYYYRGASEHVVFGVRGSLKTRGAPATWFGTRRLRHSEKPDEFYRMVEEHSYGPRLDIFARRPRDGWHVFGNEVDCDVLLRIPAEVT